jgi:endoglucanase
MMKNSAQGAERIHVNSQRKKSAELRGCAGSAFKVQPDIGSIDTTLARHLTPGVPDKDATTVQGKGFRLHVRDHSSRTRHWCAD